MGKGRRIPNAIAASKHHITANAIGPTQLTTSIHTLQCNIQGLLPHNTLHTFECSLCSAHALHPASLGPAVPHPLLCGQCAGPAVQPLLLLPAPLGPRLEFLLSAERTQVCHAKLQAGGTRGNHA